MPKSPKAILVPPVAAPERPGWCCLRCLTRRGINIRLQLPQQQVRRTRGQSLALTRGRQPKEPRPPQRVGASRSCTAGRTIRTVRAVTARSTLGTGRGSSLLASKLLGRLIALVDPDLHADAAERRTSLVEAVVDVGAQGVQRHATLAVEL